ELGGKDPAIVTATADLDNAVRAITRSAFGATGQACQSLERAYVAREVFDDFLERLVQAANGIRLNRRRIDRGHLGPLILPGLADRIRRQLDDARAGGARVHCGGRIEDHGGGQWCRPTVLSGVRPDMFVMREETFGPLIAVMPTASSREAIEQANDSDYGLSGAVFSGSAAEAEAIAVQLEVGAVSINDAGLTAFVNDVEKHSFKWSGMGGSRMGDDGMRRFLRKRALLFQTGAAASIDLLRENQAE
ncbi:MAG: aldehyde dehydrogenase family protein, partial [Rhodospirillaceae bacterium]|nr:aldehyde dehydrogenase family protein [Rhodospirillaceae bacterium]